MSEVNTTYIEKIAKCDSAMNNESQEIGERLRQAREAAGMDRKTVHARLGRGFSVSAVQAHENGRNDLRPSVMLTYCRLYKVSLPWLITGKGDPQGNGAAIDIDEIVLGDAIFTALAGLKDLHPDPSDDEIQALADAAARAYERLTARNAKKTG